LGVKEAEPKTYTEIFEEVFPFYLSIGMSYEEFWEGDLSLPKFYREAEKQRNKRRFDEMNYNCWLQGLYNYEAFSCTIANAFRKKNSRPISYLEKPIEFTPKSEQKQLTEEQIEKEQLRFKLQMSSWTKMFKNLPMD
jgi:hypothetical protein